MKSYSIYKIVCIANNKCYVGSSKEPKIRFKDHLRFIEKNDRDYWRKYPEWKEDYIKYGDDGFYLEIIANVDCDDLNAVLLLEDYYIIISNSIACGYNNELTNDKSELLRNTISKNTINKADSYRNSRFLSEYSKWEDKFDKIFLILKNKNKIKKPELIKITNLKESEVRSIMCLCHSSLQFIEFKDGELKITKDINANPINRLKGESIEEALNRTGFEFN